MSRIREIVKEYDLELLKQLELEEQEYDKLKKMRLKIETTLEELVIKILSKKYRNETRGLRNRTRNTIRNKKTKNRR